MTLTKPNPGSIRATWKRNVYRVRKNQNPFGRFEGTSMGMPIMEEREGLSNARSMTYTLIEKLKTRGKGIETMVGQEEDIGNKSAEIYPTWLQNATVVRIDDQHEAAFDIYAEQRPVLNEWMADMDTTRTIEALFSIGNFTSRWEADSTRKTSRTLFFSDGNTAQQDAYLTDNPDRVLFGDSFGNTVAGDFDASLAAVTGAMVMNYDVLRLMVRQAEKTDWENGIYPVHPFSQDGYQRQKFVVFHSTENFNNLLEDERVQRLVNSHISAKGMENTVYRDGGDLIIGKTINVEVPEMDNYLDPNLEGAGAGAAVDLTGSVLVGRQAVCKGIGQNARPTRRKEDDYEQFRGVGIRAMDAYEKVFYATEAQKLAGTPGRQYGTINAFLAKQ